MNWRAASHTQAQVPIPTPGLSLSPAPKDCVGIGTAGKPWQSAGPSIALPSGKRESKGLPPKKCLFPTPTWNTAYYRAAYQKQYVQV